MEGFSIKIDYYPQNNDIVIIKLLGYVDQSNSQQIEKVISDLIQSSKQRFVFDLSELIYMSSAGWGIFVGEVKYVREVGGDIKVACMSPEIYDVFQVLEFYHILEDYSTVDEAVSSFMENGNEGIEKLLSDNLSMPVKPESETDVDSKSELSDNEKSDDAQTGTISSDKVHEKKPGGQRASSPKSKATGPSSQPSTTEINIDLSKLPLTEKIKKIVAVYPLLNLRQIKKMLRHEKFGSVKINLINLYRMLRLLNLHTKINRYRYYRSV